MRKLMRRIVFCTLLAALVWCGTLLADRNRLHEELIRLHVVANSDREEDQKIKLKVRDAVTNSLQSAMKDISDVQQAKIYLEENLPKIEKIVNATLQDCGVDYQAMVTLCEEAFDTRFYDTFTLPAGIYHALRITIGQAQGKNWWCVVFPSLCIPATAEGFIDATSCAGFPDVLNAALVGENGYELRFFMLDTLGKLENMFIKG